RLEGPNLTAGRHSDKRSPFAVEELPVGCLYLADLGFYSGRRLARLRGRGGAKRYFVSRYQPHTRLYDRHGQRLELVDLVPVQVVVRLRWQIEWLFRLWKEHGHLDEWRSLDPWRILCELYAKLTAMVIQHWLITAGCWQDPHRSLVKAAQVVRREAGRLMMALCEGNLEQVIGSILQCMQAGCRLNTRRTFSNTSQFVFGAPLV